MVEAFAKSLEVIAFDIDSDEVRKLNKETTALKSLWVNPFGDGKIGERILGIMKLL